MALGPQPFHMHIKIIKKNLNKKKPVFISWLDQ